MAAMVKVAMQLARDGSIPGPEPHRRRSEFLRRCAEAVKAIAPQTETDVQQLSAEDQNSIRRSLGSHEAPFDGCMSAGCLDEETTWLSAVSGISRCSRCRMPKSFGRSWQGMTDLISTTQGLRKRLRDWGATDGLAKCLRR
jgi:hypothetical protein